VEESVCIWHCGMSDAALRACEEIPSTLFTFASRLLRSTSARSKGDRHGHCHLTSVFSDHAVRSVGGVRCGPSNLL